MAENKVIQVKSKDHGGETIVINERDFDKDKHTRVTPEGETESTGAPVHYGRVGGQVNSNEPHKPTGQGAIERNLPPTGVVQPSEWFGADAGGILHGIAEQQELEKRRLGDVTPGVKQATPDGEEAETTGSVVRDNLKAGLAVPASLASAGADQQGVEAYDPGTPQERIEQAEAARQPAARASRAKADNDSKASKSK